jgi:hypothetical protein
LIIHRELISALNIKFRYFPLPWVWSGGYCEGTEVKGTTSHLAHIASAPLMNKSTTLKLTEDQLMRLLDGMLSIQAPLQCSEAGCIEFLSNDRKAHEALIRRLKKALNRLDDAATAPTSQRVHLPKVEALLNELL